MPVREGLVFSEGLGTWCVEHFPIGIPCRVRRGMVVHFGDVSRLAVFYVKFVHLLFDVIKVAVADLRGILTVIGVKHFSPGAATGNGSVHLKAEQLIKALRTWGELLKVVV